MKENKFTSEFLTKLVAITLFLLWHIRTGGGDDLEEFDCIGKDEEVYRMILLDMPYTQNSLFWLVFKEKITIIFQKKIVNDNYRIQKEYRHISYFHYWTGKTKTDHTAIHVSTAMN